MKHPLQSILAISLIFVAWCSASAQVDILLLSVLSLKPPLEKLLPAFERRSGHKVRVTYARTLETQARVVRGEAFDVVIMAAPYAEALASGNVVPSSATTLLSFVQTIAVKKGAPKPEVVNRETVKNMLLAAKSVSQVDPTNGRVGMSASDMMQRLGITQQLQSKIRLYKTEADGLASVLKGETEVCMCPYLSDLMWNDRYPGIDVLGPLPWDISTPTDLVAFISSRSQNSAAGALIDYLTSTDAAAIYNAERMMVWPR